MNRRDAILTAFCAGWIWGAVCLYVLAKALG